MIVILEGPDGGGKTTLAKHLQEHHGFQYVHTGPPESDKVLEAYGKTLYDASRSSGNFVIDRLHVGERIYGPALRDQDRLGRTGEVLIHRLISAYGARLVFCLPPYNAAFRNWKKKHSEGSELIEKQEIYTHVYHKYQEAVNNPLYASASWYDYTKLNLDIAARMLLDFHYPATLPFGVIGGVEPRFLFVGEQANQEYLDLPFFALNGSSNYLNECLAEAGYEERHLALMNAMDLKGSTMPLSETYMTLKEPKVIALGSHAHLLLDHARVKNVMVPHPSYWKRFHSASRSVYVKQLREIRIGAYHHKG
jgi:hypothetical protein